MTRRYLAQALFAASLGAFAAAGYAQTPSTTDQTPGSPGAAAPAAGAGTTAGRTTAGTTTSTYANGTMQTGTMRPMTDADIAAYEKAGTACSNGPAAQRDQCWSGLYTQYHVHPKCQKLTGK